VCAIFSRSAPSAVGKILLVGWQEHENDPNKNIFTPIPEILPETYSSYKIDKNEGFQTLVEFDCRGVEPIAFDPRVGWCCVGVESGTKFDDIDLNEKVVWFINKLKLV